MSARVAYETTLSNPRTLDQVEAAKAPIERVGGSVIIEKISQTGMFIVTLWLPAPYTPADFLPGLPFYQI